MKKHLISLIGVALVVVAAWLWFIQKPEQVMDPASIPVASSASDPASGKTPSGVVQSLNAKKQSSTLDLRSSILDSSGNFHTRLADIHALPDDLNETQIEEFYTYLKTPITGPGESVIKNGIMNALEQQKTWPLETE